MAKSPITEAKTITAEAVLELGKHYSSKDLRSLQTKLTSTSRELHGLTGGATLLGRIGGMLSLEQRQLLRDAAQLVHSVGFNIEHAKEKRQRAEVTANKRQKERCTAAKKLVDYAYPLPCDTLGHQLEVIRLALVLNRAHCFQAFYSPTEFSMRYRNYVSDTPKTFGRHNPKAYLTSKISSLRNDLKQDIQDYLSLESERSVQDRILDVQRQVEFLYPQVSQDPYEIETLRLWSAALAPTEPQEGDQ